MRKMPRSETAPLAVPAAILALALPLLLSGCFQMRLDTNLQADGSGTFEVDYTISQTVADAVQELQALQGQDAPAPLLADFDRAELEAEARDHGVELQSFGHETVDGRQRFRMRLAFQDLESLSEMLGSQGGGGMALSRLPDGDYRLVSTSEPREAGADPETAAEPADEALAEDGLPGGELDEESGDEAAGEEELDRDDLAEEELEAEEWSEEQDLEAAEDEAESQEQMARTMELMGTMMGAMSELQIEMRITVPGDVVRHNAHRVEGRTLIWEVSGESATSMGEVVPEVVFSGKGLRIDAPPQAR